MNLKNINTRAWCFPCECEVEVFDIIFKKTKNERNQMVGKCSECGGKVSRMMGYNTIPGISTSEIEQSDDNRN